MVVDFFLEVRFSGYVWSKVGYVVRIMYCENFDFGGIYFFFIDFYFGLLNNFESCLNFLIYERLV